MAQIGIPINNSDQVVWEGVDASGDREIYLANPTRK